MARKLGVSLERNSIRSLVIQEANKQKEVLKTLLQRRYIFLKMDACTRMRTNYFAINVQFMDSDKKIVIYTLAVRETEAQHTSDCIQKIVLEVLEEYGLHKEQVLSIVTDNASNMISTVEKLNEDVTIDDNDSDLNIPVSLIEESGGEDDPHDFEYLPEAAARISEIHHMRCAVHTLQLAICDGLKGRYAANLVAIVRKVATVARTPKIDAILKRRAGKGAIIDQATRWGSTYLMIARILELKQFLSDMANPEVSMSEAHWEQVKELESLLRYPYTVTKNLQSSDLTPGRFYKEWKTLIFRLSQIGGMIADEMKASMIRRESSLLDNGILLAAIYVDPMYRVILTEDKKNKAKSTLCDVAIRMKGFQEKDQSGLQHESDETDEIPIYSSPSLSSSEDEYEKFLDDQEKIQKRRCVQSEEYEHPPAPTKLNKFKWNFFAALKEVEKIDRFTKMEVMKAIESYPEIVQEAALAVTALLGLPPTQVSVERLFSALRIIKSDLRGQMKEDLTDAILFLLTNLPNM